MDNSELKVQGDTVIEGICEICFQELNQIPIVNIREKYTGGPGIAAQLLRKGQSLGEGPAGEWQDGAGGHCGSLRPGSAPGCRLTWDSPVILRPSVMTHKRDRSSGVAGGCSAAMPGPHPAPCGLCWPQHPVCQQFSLRAEAASGQMRRGLSWQSESSTSAPPRPGEGPGTPASASPSTGIVRLSGLVRLCIPRARALAPSGRRVGQTPPLTRSQAAREGVPGRRLQDRPGRDALREAPW